MSKPVYDKPSQNEDEYFARQDAELIKQLRAKRDADAEAQQKAQGMKCPKCGGTLEEKDQHGVKVDVCPDCHGVWLDQGEIDLLQRLNRENPGTRVMHDVLRFFHKPGK